MIPILDNGLASMLLGKKTQHLFFTVLGILRLHAYKSNTLPYLSRYNVLQWVQCTHVALNSWDNPIGEMDGLFHEVRVFHTTRGHKTEGEQEKTLKLVFYKYINYYKKQDFNTLWLQFRI